jgi:predicted dienelactone hydrolase
MRHRGTATCLLTLFSFAVVSCSDDEASSTTSSVKPNGVPTNVVDQTPATSTEPAATEPSTTDLAGTEPAQAILLPVPDGPFAVGVVDLQRFSMSAYYPAREGIGHGHRDYASPAMVGFFDATAVDLAAIVPTAQISAEPLQDSGPWPVVILAPGGGSFIELSTSLAEHLASHGYIVIAVQPDIATDAGLHLGDGQFNDREIQLLEQVSMAARRTQIVDALDLLDDPLTTELVGPIDPTRVAAGGHSYGGSTAFNVSLADARIAAAFDLDGTLFEEAGSTPVSVPSLVLMAEMYAMSHTPPETSGDPAGAAAAQAALDAFELLRTAENTVSVALLDAGHYAVTDVPAIEAGLTGQLRTLATDGLGRIGRAGTTNTNTIVLRFLDAALASQPRLPTAAELVAGLPSATADPFAEAD